MNLSLPLSEFVLASAKKTPTQNELRAFAAGVMAHIAIQTLYRITHPGHFIVTERLVSMGDLRVATMSRFGRFDGLSRGGRALVDRAKKVAAKVAPAKVRKALEGDDFWALLVHLLDVSTDESSRAGFSKKRYDILDFGPLGTSDIFPVKTALAYEIKPAADVQKGAAYVARQTTAFNQTVSTLAQTLQNLFSVRGLLGYTAVPGMLWPPIPHVLPIGPNVLHFWLAEPGVIAYEWLSFKRVALKRLWEMVRKTADEVRDAYRREPRVSDDIKGLALISAAIAVVAIGLAAVELGAVAAAGLATAGTGGRMLLARVLTSGALLAPSLARAESNGKPDPLFDAIAAASDPTLASLDTGKLLLPSEQPSGGTGPTEFEAAVKNAADLIAQQFVFLYGVKVGQGDEIFDDMSTQAVKAAVSEWFMRFLTAYGVDAFTQLFGVEKLNEETATGIAQCIITNGSLFVERDTYGSLLGELVLMPMEDVFDSLPIDSGDDAE